MTTSLESLLPGDVILTAHNEFERNSLCIKIANFFYRGLKDKDWTHSALYIGEGQIVEACPDGVKTSDLKQKYIDNNYQVLVLRHKNASKQALKATVDFCKTQSGDKYDWLGLTYFLLYNFMPVQLHFLLEDDLIWSWFRVSNSYFCSELVSTGFEEANIYCFEEKPYKIMPVDFYNELLFQEVTKIGVLQKQSKWLYVSYLLVGAVCFILTIILSIILGPFVLTQWIIHRHQTTITPKS